MVTEIEVEKQCSKCGQVKPISEFYKRQERPSGIRADCKSCFNERERRWAKTPRGRLSRRKASYKWVLKTIYGLTLEDYNNLVLKQEGKCLICDKKPDKLCLDHCHRTGKVRGLLCDLCNTGIGAFHDNPLVMQRAIQYVSTGVNNG